MSQTSKVPAVDSAIQILDLLAASPNSLTLSEIAEETTLAASTTHRLLAVLLEKNMISIDPSQKKKYCMGAHIFQLASALFSRQDTIPIFHPIAEILKHETYHSVYLHVEIGNRVVVIAKTESSMAKVSNIYIGSTYPIYNSATGKAILSMHNEEYQREYLLNVLPKRADGKNTLEEMIEELKMVKRLGYATIESEKISNLCFIAAPVLNANNRPIAAISLGVPAEQFEPRYIKILSGHLIQATRQMAARLV